MRSRTVLICGAGVAGPALAYWLTRHGFRPTLVERATGLRSSGNPVDVRGEALDIARRMGVLPRLLAADSKVTHLSIVNGLGKRVARMRLRSASTGSDLREPEVPRSDLAAILMQAAGEDVEVIWNNTISSITQDEARVSVTLGSGETRSFDLVIGTDGLHSVVRHLAFAPETDCVTHLGLYIATLPIHGSIDNDSEVVLYNTPGRMASIHPSYGRPLGAFLFRSPKLAGLGHRDTAAHKRLITDRYADDAWRVPELLEAVGTADDLYFDAVSQVRLPQWSAGRVALLGDAASCVSLFGDGSTLAIVGAHTLAEELAATPDDHQAAFRRYEDRHRKLVNPRLRGFKAGAALLVPATRGGILLRNAGTRLTAV